MTTPFQRLAGVIGPARSLRLMGLYPPYLGAGVRIDHVDDDLASVTVSLGMYPWNRNAVGTHFGGSLYSLCDPWFMFLLMTRLGPGFIVWDKAATIQFLRPGRGRVTAHFAISVDEEAGVRAAVASNGKTNPVFSTTVKSEAGEDVCRVEKVLSVRRKP